MKKIDSHVHCWKLSRGDYTWLTPNLTVLYRNFLPADIKAVIETCDVNEVILIQAASTLDETHFLLSLAEEHSFISGVVGWVDLLSPNAPMQISQLTKHAKFLGIRPMIQDISEPDWMLRPELAAGLQTLQEKNLTFDALIKPIHLPYFISFLERYPHLKIVIDHAAKPNIKDKQFQSWANYIKKIAEFPEVYCKLSGLLTECGVNQTAQDILPYLDHLFLEFGEKRILWGSDFPILNVVSQYSEWYQFCYSYIQTNHKAALPWIFGDSARAFYSIKTL